MLHTTICTCVIFTTTQLSVNMITENWTDIQKITFMTLLFIDQTFTHIGEARTCSIYSPELTD